MNPPDRLPAPLSPELIARFAAIVGAKYAVTNAQELAPYLVEERNLYQGRSTLVLRPGSTAEVAAICKLATETHIALVPQGGNTGLVGGQTPHHGEVVVSLRRLDKVRDVDVHSNTMTCEAGVVLATAQARAESVDRLFPLFLAEPKAMPLEWHGAFMGARDDAARARVVADYIAGMTDRYALGEYRRLVDAGMDLA